jgi:hypothetical protein
MKGIPSRLTVLAVLLVSAALAASPRAAFTQAATTDALTQVATNDALTKPAITDEFTRTATTEALTKAVATDASAQGETTAASTKAPTVVIRNYRTKAEMEKGTEQGWEAVVQQCGTVNDACAAAANAEVTGECAADAQLFSKHTKNWKVLSFALIIASAGFTGAGAATTIAGSTTIPKIFATLGGTTGLGAVTSTVNSNVASDQAGLIAIDTELSAWLTFLQTGKPNLQAPPTPAQVYQAARTYIALCAAPAMASSGDSTQ